MAELFLRISIINIFLVFIRQSYFPGTKKIRLILNTILQSKSKISKSFNKSKLIIHPNIDFKDVMNPCKKCTAKPYSFLVNDFTLASDNPLCFRRNLSERMYS